MTTRRITVRAVDVVAIRSDDALTLVSRKRMPWPICEKCKQSCTGKYLGVARCGRCHPSAKRAW